MNIPFKTKGGIAIMGCHENITLEKETGRRGVGTLLSGVSGKQGVRDAVI